jgi:hypothetical protein
MITIKDELGETFKNLMCLFTAAKHFWIAEIIFYVKTLYSPIKREGIYFPINIQDGCLLGGS